VTSNREEEVRSKRKLGSYLLKVLISAVVLALVLRIVDLSYLGRLMLSADPFWLSLALLSFFLQQLIQIYMWGDLLRAKGTDLPFRLISYVFFVGIFFGTFLPSTAAVDVVRVAAMTRHLKNKIDSITSMLLFRVIGTLVLIFISLIFILGYRDQIENPAIANLILGFSVFMVGGFLVVSNSFFRDISVRIFHWIRIHRLAEITENFFRSLSEYMKYRSVLIRIVVLSVVIQVMRIVMVYWIGISLGVDISILYYFMFIPIITVLTMLPISLAGIGISEGSYVYFFAVAGVGNAEAVSISLLYFLMSIVIFIFSGIVYLLGKNE